MPAQGNTGGGGGVQRRAGNVSAGISAEPRSGVAAGLYSPSVRSRPSVHEDQHIERLHVGRDRSAAIFLQQLSPRSAMLRAPNGKAGVDFREERADFRFAPIMQNAAGRVEIGGRPRIHEKVAPHQRYPIAREFFSKFDYRRKIEQLWFLRKSLDSGRGRRAQDDPWLRPNRPAS